MKAREQSALTRRLVHNTDISYGRVVCGGWRAARSAKELANGRLCVGSTKERCCEPTSHTRNCLLAASAGVPVAQRRRPFLTFVLNDARGHSMRFHPHPPHLPSRSSCSLQACGMHVLKLKQSSRNHLTAPNVVRCIARPASLPSNKKPRASSVLPLSFVARSCTANSPASGSAACSCVVEASFCFVAPPPTLTLV